MMFQLPPLKVNLPKPKYRKQEVVTEDGRRVKCLRRDTYLDMSQMALALFPKMVLRCDDLETLIFCRNFLRELPRKITRLECLMKLDLSYNRFGDFPDEILSLTSLKELDISHNVITSIPIDIRYLRYLKVLNVSDNRIKRLPNNMQHLTSLVYLNVSCNKLEEYSLTLCTCYHQLQVLKCSYNYISIIPYEIIMLPELCLKPGAVDFSHNPITWPPIEIVLKGFETMRNYIEPKWKDLKEFKQRKIIQDTLNSTKTHITKSSLWETAPSISSKGSSVMEKRSQKRQKPAKEEPKIENLEQNTLKTPASEPKSKGSKAVKTTKKKKTLQQSLEKQQIEREKDGELDDSSRATLVEVYRDGSSPINQLSPLPDTWSPAKTPANDEDSDGLERDRISLVDDDDRESELLDLVNQSLEPPDLDLPDSMLNMSSGGGILEQWLGTVQSMTMSPTTRDVSCASTELESSNLHMHMNPFTPFSDVKITKNMQDESGGSDEEDEEEEEDDEGIRDEVFLAPANGHFLDVEHNLSRHSISTPDLSERLSVIFSDDARPKPEQEQSDIKRKADLQASRTKGPKKQLPTQKLRRSSTHSVLSETTTITSNKGTKKKRSRKKKKKKQKTEVSEFELYSRIPFKPLFIAPRALPTFRGLKTWAYFTEPKSCYLIDNMTEISSSTKRVTFGTDEVTIMQSSPSNRSMLTGSCVALNSSNSSLDRTASVHSIESNQSQLLSASISTMSQFSNNNNLSSTVGGHGDSLSPFSGVRSSVRNFDSNCSSPAAAWSRSNPCRRRPSSLPAPKQHTWTSEELQRYIYRPSDLIIPPKVLVSYLKQDNEEVYVNQIIKLVNTLELNGLAECICDLTTTEDYDFEELGYFEWLNEQVQECEFILVVISKHYIQSLPVLTKLDSLITPHTSASYRNSPYITAADIKRWGMNHSEVQRRFIPVLNDDMEQMQTPSWFQTLPFFIPSEICELGYHLISRDSRESVIIPNIFDGEESDRANTDLAEESRGDDLLVYSSSDLGSKRGEDNNDLNIIPPDVFRVLPVTAHLVVPPQDVPPDWRLDEVAGKLRYSWRDFAQTCGFDGERIADIDSVYSGSLNKAVQCLRLWKGELVGNATYEELARRLDQIDQKHIADAYCNFGNFGDNI